MVIAGVKRVWATRLAHLTGLVEAEASGPAWLWRIRIRILSYLLARYGEPGDVVAAGPDADEPDAGDPFWTPPESPPLKIPAAQPPVAVEHPPKPGAVITPILTDIHEVNTDVRLGRWENPPAEQVWTWWWAVWCRTP